VSLYAYSRVVFSWGYTVRPPGPSAGGPSLPLPPPSTLIGALAAGVARLLGWGEVVVEAPAGGRGRGSRVSVASSAWRLARHALAAGARLQGPVALWQDVVRYSTLPYQTPGNLADPAQWFGAQNFGLAMAPGAVLDMVVVFDDSIADEGVTPGVLGAAAASIQRLGGREGLVHVAAHSAGRARVVGGGETSLYAPLDSLDHSTLVPGEFVVFEAWNPRCPEAYRRASPLSLEPLILAAPLRPTPALNLYRGAPGRLRLRDGTLAYEGGWPRELGVVAGIPECRGGGAG
jgi:CRISPR-associated protein Cas5 subtype I-A